MAERMNQPPFMLYIAWHPDYVKGAEIAERLYHHFGSHHYRSTVGGVGVSVLFRSTDAPCSTTPLPIEWNYSGTTAVVVLIDNVLAGDSVWIQYIRDLVSKADSRGFGACVFLVTMETGALDIGLDEQALRWDRWAGNDDERERHLIQDLTYEFSRMLRHHLGLLQHTNTPDELESYLKKVHVFLSHSKHDEHGEPVAKAVRDWLHGNSSLSSFLDVYDIPAGLPFAAVMDHSIKTGVLLAIYTDSYSSRQCCRHEMIEAKRNNVPMLVVDCLQTVDERVLPYLGNVPAIRMDPNSRDRIEQIAGLLLDEVFKNLLWQCRTERLRRFHPQIMFTARPPEMISLAGLPPSTGGSERLIVYPDPPLSAEEARLLSDVVCDLHLYSLTQWQGEAEA